jgi:NADH-quinone oxidoreductase subunit J
MNTAAFIVVAVVTLSGALAAACLQKLIHAALFLVITFVGVAAFYFWLGAEFVGLVQIFVYVGAVAILIVFTILLTRREAEERHRFNWTGVPVALAVFAGLTWAIVRTPTLGNAASAIEPVTVKRIGEMLMSDFVWPLQCVGVLLTAALIGALLLVIEERS